MNALWLENHKLSFRKDVPVPVPQPGEALVRVRLAGICSTDLELVKGYLPFTGIPGHEFVGDVISAPEGAGDWSGRRVVGDINLTCGTCEQCLSGRSTHCSKRTVLGILNHDGAFAEFLSLPVINLHQVPDSVTDEAAVFTEPLAAALEIQQQVHIHPDDRVLVIGAGRLGLLIAETLSLTGCELKAVTRHERQRKLLDGHGICSIWEEDIPEGKMDVVVEATGSPAGFLLARKAVRPRGTIVLKSTYKGEQKADFSSLVVEEITLVGSRCGPFLPALRLLKKKKVDPAALIDARYPLSDGIRAMEHASRP
ncbi:MAG: alcohol dehydrogenase catalytic domain-containing protein, partial [Spirochaetes bacterium]|nr:alcohol dehydrogenase catalytic domain-containing protein [Spirochaetota bacterium]